MLAQNELLLHLLDHNADVNSAPGSLGWTPLHLCSLVNNEEGAEKLLAHGAALFEDLEGNTARMLAERAGHEALVQLLIDHVDPAETAEEVEELGDVSGGSKNQGPHLKKNEDPSSTSYCLLESRN